MLIDQLTICLQRPETLPGTWQNLMHCMDLCSSYMADFLAQSTPYNFFLPWLRFITNSHTKNLCCTKPDPRMETSFTYILKYISTKVVLPDRPEMPFLLVSVWQDVSTAFGFFKLEVYNACALGLSLNRRVGGIFLAIIYIVARHP